MVTAALNCHETPCTAVGACVVVTLYNVDKVIFDWKSVIHTLLTTAMAIKFCSLHKMAAALSTLFISTYQCLSRIQPKSYRVCQGGLALL